MVEQVMIKPRSCQGAVSLPYKGFWQGGSNNILLVLIWTFFQELWVTFYNGAWSTLTRLPVTVAARIIVILLKTVILLQTEKSLWLFLNWNSKRRPGYSLRLWNHWSIFNSIEKRNFGNNILIKDVDSNEKDINFITFWFSESESSSIKV